MFGRETIAQVREQTSLVDLVGDTVKLEQRGRCHVGLCPFHRETSPSFYVNEARGYYHCAGCHESGDAIRFLQHTEGLSHDDAVRRLADRVGLSLPDTADDRAARQRRQALYDANEAAAEYFERMLRDHPLGRHAASELARRALTPGSPTDAIADALQSFRVGYAPHGWESLSRHLREAGASLAAAETVGLLVSRPSGAGYYDRFRHRLMFAVVDLRGRVVAFSGRALPEPSASELAEADLPPTDSARASETSAKYINSPESPVYRKSEAVFGLHQARQAIRESAHCILVEGNFDVVSLHARGIRNTVAPLGTAFTAEQARLLKRFAPRVTFMFDADAAGRRAVATAREACREAGLIARVATLPDGCDPDEFVRVQGPDAIRSTARNASDLLEYLVDTTLESGLRADDVQTKAAKIHEVAALLASENDPKLRTMAKQFADRVAEQLGIADPATFRAVAATVHQALVGAEQAQRPTRCEPLAPVAHEPTTGASRPVEEEIFGALLDWPDLMDDEAGIEAISAVGSQMGDAIDALRQSWTDGKRLDLEQLLAKLPRSIHPFAAARLAAPRYETQDEARTKLLDNTGKLRRLQLRSSSSEVEELKRAAASGDFDREIALLREHERRAKKRHGL